MVLQPPGGGDIRAPFRERSVDVPSTPIVSTSASGDNRQSTTARAIADMTTVSPDIEPTGNPIGSLTSDLRDYENNTTAPPNLVVDISTKTTDDIGSGSPIVGPSGDHLKDNATVSINTSIRKFNVSIINNNNYLYK